jgi:hypothetical protein
MYMDSAIFAENFGGTITFFYSFGPYPYPFDPYPDVVSYEVAYKTVFFEGDRCTGWE